CLQGYSTPWTF
nr:immunoglobulin light chain junction region [Macaca mulatta]NSM00236.1 immunoglobulin light chain junction region [Mus musculus]MOX97335.1 immunoglobulin light chain junction region [Macaca mulatta]MOX98039.1 immunoglobulin light chain junction region [Macaca mulatta]MOX98111.1 immunoglobulin light chain junction region [Macaca mulatta]